MKVIIEIPYHIYEMVTNTGTFGYYHFDTRKAIRNGIPIPDNATNGDVLQAMFPYVKPYLDTDLGGCQIVRFDFYKAYNGSCKFSKEWWNSPYQKGGKE